MSKFSQLVQYFERLASEHKKINHSPTQKHFFRFELDEIFTGLGNGINYPALIMEGYGFTLADQRSDNSYKKRECAFVLLQHVPDPGDYDLIHKVWDDLEEIGDDIIARMVNDKRKPGSPMRDFGIETVAASMLSTEFGNLYGIRYTFNIDSHFSRDINPDKWNLESE